VTFRYLGLLERYCGSAVLLGVVQNRVVLLAAESKPHTKFVWQPLFCDMATIEPAVQEEVKCAIIPLDQFETRLRDLVQERNL
jgi:hypothetical protein